MYQLFKGKCYLPINFDRLTTDFYDPVPNGYRGMNWNNIYFANKDAARADPTYANTGYVKHTGSEPNVAVNAMATTAGSIL